MADQQEQETGQKLLLDLAWERQQKKVIGQYQFTSYYV